MTKLTYPSHSLPHIAHVNHVTKLGVRVEVEETRLKDVKSAHTPQQYVEQLIVSQGQPYLKSFSIVLNHFLHLHFAHNLKNIERR